MRVPSKMLAASSDKKNRGAYSTSSSTHFGNFCLVARQFSAAHWDGLPNLVEIGRARFPRVSIKNCG